LRVTLENFKSMFAPVVFSVVWNVIGDISALSQSDAIPLRDWPPRASYVPLLDLVWGSYLNRRAKVD